MDIAPMVTTTTTTTNTVTILDPDSPEPEPEPPIRIQSAKPISFSNGKRHHHPHPPAAPPLGTVTYRECLKNHAAGIGGHALDGCGEFMPAPSFDPTDPTSLACAACGCHRNFHRRDDPSSSSAAAIEFRPHNRHQPPPPLPLPLPPPLRSPDDDSASPPPISSSYMLLALSGGRNSSGGGGTAAPGSQKRFRTKFSQYQKERMLEFAERLGWRMPKAAEDAGVREFCRQIGVDKGVFKVWMHNNKNNGRGGGRRGFGSIGGDRREKMGESDNVGGVAAEGSFST